MTPFHAHGNMLPRAMQFLMMMVLAFSLTSKAQAEDEPSALSLVYTGIIQSYYSVNGFYNFSANQADKTQNEIITDAVDNIADVMSSLEDLVPDSASEQFDTAKQAWEQYRDILQENVEEVQATGYPDLRLAGDMANFNITFNDAMQDLYGTLSASSNPPAEVQTSRDAAKTLALMMTKYSARSTSTVSQVYAGGDAEITIDALAAQFDAKISKLTDMAKGSPEKAKALDSAMTKWDFIKDSYINYNENRVNFIVNLYSKRIISDIESILVI